MKAEYTSFVCHDDPAKGSAQKRLDHLVEHLAYIEKFCERILVAGPLYNKDGTTINGSLFIYATNDQEKARSWLEKDPYFKAGFWATVDCRPFYGAIGTAVGGINY